MKCKGFIGLMLCMAIYLMGCSQPTKEEEQAMNVIERYAGGQALPVKIAITLDKQDGRDVFETSVKNGVLYVNASSGVAACRGFYEYVKSQKAGISSWSGNRVLY